MKLQESQSISYFFKPIFQLQAFDMSPYQIKTYFENTEYHPKYNQIDTNTKYFYEELIHRVKRHKIGKGDRGMKEAEDICLPKPPKDLKYITVEGVPGLKIPRDDEDFTSGKPERFFVAAGFIIKFGLIKKLPFEDKPFYFESEEEAIELWKKHFPTGQ